jgi:hypothetical protein
MFADFDPKNTLLVVLTVVFLFTGLYFVQTRKSTNAEPSYSSIFSRSTSSQNSVQPEIVEITNQSLFMGNVFFGRYIDDWAAQSANPQLKRPAMETDQRNYNFPFEKLNTLERSKYDSWIAGLECPITSQFVNSMTQDNSLSFTCLPGYLPEAKKVFDVFTLANNHTDNMGFEGFASTRKALSENEIQYFGHYDNAVKSDICEVVSLKAQAKMSDDSKKEVKIPLAFCGYHNVFKLPTEDQIAVISAYSKYLPTIVMPHQGAEYTTTSDAIKRDTYKRFVDAGADLVVGDHPHTTQETEVYKGKLIVYSLGNFIFDQQFNANVTQAIALDSKLTFGKQQGLESLVGLAAECQKFQDSCLQTLEKNNSQKPKFDFKFEIIATDNAGKQTQKASPEVQTKMLQRSNWSKTKTALTEKN